MILAMRTTPLPPYLAMFVPFVMLFLMYCMFCLRNRVDNAPFKGNQEQQFDKETQQFGKEGMINLLYFTVVA